MVQRVIKLTTCHGKTLKAFEGDSITDEIRGSGCYDKWALDAIASVLPLIDADLSLDVGANIGNHAVVIADYCRALIAFEPVPFIFEVLRENLAHNTTNARAVNLALSNREGEDNIAVDTSGNLGKSSMRASAADRNVSVQAQIGDRFMDTETGHLDFVKLDMEGFEPHVISGLHDTIVRDQPLILLEWNAAETRDGFREQAILSNTLAGYQGYSVTHTWSKQISGHGLRGAIYRIRKRRNTPREWCLSDFDFDKSYASVLMFPQRYQNIVEQLPYHHGKA